MFAMATPRTMLRQLRAVMARPDGGDTPSLHAQTRLDEIVSTIAHNLLADVCSIYLRLPDGRMELYASFGLRAEAVHAIRLAPGEGIVGLIASSRAPINLDNADSHPAFAHKPETGEERYSSFAGVPITRVGQVIGVLTMQHRTQRFATLEEIEALETIAMVLAEMLARAGVTGIATANEIRGSRSRTFKGIPLSRGSALGHIVLHEPRAEISQMFADDAGAERARLDAALIELGADVDRKRASGEANGSGEFRDVLEVYRMFADSRGWRDKIKSAINDGLTAEGAVEKVHNQMRVTLSSNDTAMWRERIADMEDLANRLLRILSGRPGVASGEHMFQDAIVVARNMGPAELLDYQRESIRGLVLEEGSPTSHVAIVAKALGIPALCQVTGVLGFVERGHPAVLDTDMATLAVQPSQSIVNAFATKMRQEAVQQARYFKLSDTPAITRDGIGVGMHMNAGLLLDLPNLIHADGIGLFRTELHFMIAAKFPRVGEQAATYANVLAAAGDKPVVFRALDVGGDKMLPYAPKSDEENPALGWRAIRMSLDKPGLFRLQMRALLRAASGRELRVMIPFVASVGEFRAARALLERELDWARRMGRDAPSRLSVGAMIEVPAILWQLGELLPLTDFVSVGSNDLMQFIYAADRGNARTATRFDTLHPAGLRALRGILAEADAHRVPITLCGEMAGNPVDALALVGLGFRALSMAPGSIGPVKSALLSLDAANLTAELEQWIADGATDVRARLTRYAQDHGIPL